MRKIFITGASRGLGLEFTKQYLKGGHQVIASCRNPDSALDLQALKKEHKDNLLILKLDVTNETERERAYEEIKNRFNSLNILVNNAGIISGNEEQSSVLGEIYKEDFSKVFQVNSIAPLLIAEKMLPLLEKGKNAKIVNITSQNGSISLRNVGGKYSYSASKAALNMISKILSNDLKEKEISVFAIHPGWILTDMGGPNAPLKKEEPIKKIIGLIEERDISDSGKFLDWKGEEIPW